MKNMAKQKGAALITALVCLILVSLMGVLSMNTATTSSKIAANAKQSSQAIRMAESAIVSFFINPAEAWNARTVAGVVNNFAPVAIGNAQVPLQAEYKNDAVCGIKKGKNISSGEDSTGATCVFFRLASNYQVNALTQATASAGFYVEIEKN